MERRPFDGAFRIGAWPIPLDEWLVRTPDHARQIARKRELLELGADIVRSSPETADAERDAFDRIAEWHASQDIPFEPGDVALSSPLLRAGLAIEDDLVLMRRGADHWHLAAAALFFPSSWRLAEKFGKPLDQVHAPVPGFSTGSRNDRIISRMFDALRPDEPVTRANWSLHSTDALRLESGACAHDFHLDQPLLDQVTWRSERQTLRKLDQSGDILFTIAISVTPMADALEAGHGANMIEALDRLTPEEARYKGLDPDVIAALIKTARG